MCLVVLVVFSKCHHPAYYRLVDACEAGFVRRILPPDPIPRGVPYHGFPNGADQHSQDSTPGSTISVNSCRVGNNEELPNFRRTRVPYCGACIAVEEDKILFQYESEIRVTLASLEDTTLDFLDVYGVGKLSVERSERKMMRELEDWWVESAVPSVGKTKFLARVGDRAGLVLFFQEKFLESCVIGAEQGE